MFKMSQNMLTKHVGKVVLKLIADLDKHVLDKHGLDEHGLDKHGLDKHGLDKLGLDKHGPDSVLI